jgi:serine/threonine protein kinase
MDSGVSSEGVAFLVMELLEGRTLGQELAIHGPLSLRRCARIAADVADVLAVAHRRGILHRDIKPENIFLHQSPQGEVVKVVDFGLAKFFGEHSDATPRPELTRIGEMMGTPTYIAPERMAGVSDDVRSDIFSLGAVLYKMICGKTPWSREDRMEVIAGLRKILPRPMQMFRQHVPVELERLVQTALAIDPRQRPNTDEFAAALAELVDELADEPAHADVAETDATPACAIN